MALPQSATARDNTGALIGVGLAALLGGALLGAASSSQPTPPPPSQPIQWQAPPAPHVPTLFEKAQQGNLAAQLQVARNYASGSAGLKQNDALAYNWYSKAAERGNAEAMREVGITLAEGRGGVEKNETEAFDWFTKAAALRDPIAAYQLGHFYKDGIVVTKDDGLAIFWFNQAAEQGNIPATTMIQDYASAGNADAQNDLGNLYLNGQSVEQSDKQAITWYKLAARQGDSFAQANLAYMYASGKGTVVNDKEAARWMTYSAQQGNGVAQTKLGGMYVIGRGVNIDKQEAYKWFALASVKVNAQNGADPAVVTALKNMTTQVQADLSADEIAAAQKQAQQFEVKSYSKNAMDNFERLETYKTWAADYWPYGLGVLLTALTALLVSIGLKRRNAMYANGRQEAVRLTVVSTNPQAAPIQEKICISCNGLIRAKAEMCPKCGTFQDANPFPKTA